jgi:chromosome condensin MukBEF complex kleisin-like MukF subunit
MSGQLVGLLTAALGVWRETVESQDRLSKAVDSLQAEMNDIKDFSALPIFRAGLPLLGKNISRVQACKKRIAAVGARLKRVDLNLQKVEPYR